MPYLTVGRENSGETDVYYEDHGSSRPAETVERSQPMSMGQRREMSMAPSASTCGTWTNPSALVACRPSIR